MAIETIGLGMVVSFFFTETVGLAAGGIVVPGYFALTFADPARVVMTVLVAWLTFLILKTMSQFMLVYGRRMLMLGVLVGYLLGYVTKIVPPLPLNHAHLDVSVVGFVIPGLMAYWMHRQGVIETISSMLVAAVLTRLVIIVVSGGAL